MPWNGARPVTEEGLRNMSTKPYQMRNRLRRAKKRAEKTGDDTDLKWEIARYSEVTGFKPVEEWDLEELAHGKPRNADGSFRGRPPTWITPEVTREAKKLLYTQTLGKMGAHVDTAVKVVANLMTNEETDDKGKPIVDARTKLAAAQFIIEHVVGKPDKVVTLDATDSARQMFAAAIVLDDGQPQGHLMAHAGSVIAGELAGPVVDEDPDLGVDDD